MCSGVGRLKESSAKQCICLECFRTLFVKPIIPLQLLSFITRSSCSSTSTLAGINNQRCPANDTHRAVEAKEQAPRELQQPCSSWESEGAHGSLKGQYVCVYFLLQSVFVILAELKDLAEQYQCWDERLVPYLVLCSGGLYITNHLIFLCGRVQKEEKERRGDVIIL